jgi:hypothetical protein
MPINHLVKEHHSLGPDEVKVLATAFDAALLELGLEFPNLPVATKFISNLATNIGYTKV